METVILNPEKEISNILSYNGFGEGLVVDHIKYDNSINDNFQYQIIRGSTHDGTLLFTKQLIDKALIRLINKESYCKGTITEDELKDLKDVKYTIGDIKLDSEQTTDYKYGDGIKETVSIPVNVEYIFD